jgi:Kelch motif
MKIAITTLGRLTFRPENGLSYSARTGSIPSPRVCHTAVLVDDVMYVFGGFTGKSYLGDLYALQLSST